MKKVLLVLFAVMLSASFMGCTSYDATTDTADDTATDTSSDTATSTSDKSADTQTVQSTDSGLTLDVPADWTEQELNSIATIEMGQPVDEQYLAVFEELVSTFPEGTTLDSFAEASVDSMISSTGSTDTPVVSTVQIAGGIDARQYEFTAMVSGIEAKYLMTCIQNDVTFYQIATWSTSTNYNSAKPVYEDVLDSIKFV